MTDLLTTGRIPRLAAMIHPSEPSRPCQPAETIERLNREGRLLSFARWWDVPADDISGGDCHRIASMLFEDLFRAGCAAGWELVDGKVGRLRLDHSWLEDDGWAIDVANGHCDIYAMAEFERLAMPERSQS